MEQVQFLLLAYVAVGVDDLRGVDLAEAGESCRAVAQVARALGRRDDDRAAPVGHQAAIEQVERLDDEARSLVVGDRDRLALLGGRVATWVP